MTMTKAEMISRICEKAHVSKDDAIKLVEDTFDIIEASLERGQPVKIYGFGNFVVRTKHPRKGRNPQTGAEIVIPQHKVLTFKASPIIKKTIQTDSIEQSAFSHRTHGCKGCVGLRCNILTSFGSALILTLDGRGPVPCNSPRNEKWPPSIGNTLLASRTLNAAQAITKLEIDPIGEQMDELACEMTTLKTGDTRRAQIVHNIMRLRNSSKETSGWIVHSRVISAAAVLFRNDKTRMSQVAVHS